MTSLTEIAESDFDVVAALDNALPHLTSGQLCRAIAAMRSKLKSNGLFIASIRDYDSMILKRPTTVGPSFFGKHSERRIVHQVWDWIDDARYTLHLYITTQFEQAWTTHHFVSEYRCLLRNELSTVLESAGFREVRWLMPADSGRPALSPGKMALMFWRGNAARVSPSAAGGRGRGGCGSGRVLLVRRGTEPMLGRWDVARRHA